MGFGDAPAHDWSVDPLGELGARGRREAAAILFDSFAEHWPNAWPTLAAAEAEVGEALEPVKLAYAARSEPAGVLGWIGGQPLYDGRVWELHPLAVHGAARGRGIARALVERLEREVGARGALTLWVGTDDEAEMTSVGGIDLYPHVLEKLSRLENRRRHPMGLYLRLGFEVVGVVPDANGFGRPDILMAKRVAKTPPTPGASVASPEEHGEAD